MDKQTQPTQPVETQPQTPPPTQVPQQTNSTNTILIALVVLLLLVVVGGAAYLYGSGKLGTLVTAPTPTPTVAQQEPLISETPILIASASPSTTVKPKPTIVPNPDGNTFTSDKLGIAFYYSNTMGYDKNTTIKILDEGNKVYLYEKSMVPTTGQSIERFSKNPGDTLSQAISKKFLAGIPITDCFVKLDPKKPSPTMTKATIGYPIPENADQPNFTYGEKCPEHYSESNGMAYFLEDSNYPDRFYFVSIGQYGIPAQNSKPDSMWQDTIVVF